MSSTILGSTGTLDSSQPHDSTVIACSCESMLFVYAKLRGGKDGHVLSMLQWYTEPEMKDPDKGGEPKRGGAHPEGHMHCTRLSRCSPRVQMFLENRTPPLGSLAFFPLCINITPGVTRTLPLFSPQVERSLCGITLSSLISSIYLSPTLLTSEEKSRWETSTLRSRATRQRAQDQRQRLPTAASRRVRLLALDTAYQNRPRTSCLRR